MAMQCKVSVEPERDFARIIFKAGAVIVWKLWRLCVGQACWQDGTIRGSWQEIGMRSQWGRVLNICCIWTLPVSQHSPYRALEEKPANNPCESVEALMCLKEEPEANSSFPWASATLEFLMVHLGWNVF